ncbi:SDR family NAD(P)-dependent oxidoreductase [Streptomyces sp. NPDC017993]|uniref:SDR family NAD(P)-dependent oxidoreductase n=1 Tax=Streptomyces sp. NPDC017993 TaxID=3365027 RepID=UPI0037A4D3E4
MGAGELSGRTALVTGAGGSAGEAVARLLADHGARVIAVDRDADGIAALRSAYGAARMTTRAVDITDRAAVENLVDEAERTVGPLDILVNAAGVRRAAPVVELSDQDWDDLFAVNTTGVFHLSRAVARRMTARRAGSIITVGSHPLGVPRAGLAAYAASKAAAAFFTKCLGNELAPSGVRCNVVSPGAPRGTGPRRRPAPAGTGGSARGAARTTQGSATRPGPTAETHDLAETIAFLVSDRARHITMHDLHADGALALRA